jgi:hypothetical protein
MPLHSRHACTHGSPQLFIRNKLCIWVDDKAGAHWGGGGEGLLNGFFLYKKGEITEQSGMLELDLFKRFRSKY